MGNQTKNFSKFALSIAFETKMNNSFAKAWWWQLGILG